MKMLEKVETKVVGLLGDEREDRSLIDEKQW
jgi:hypothetical protein